LSGTLTKASARTIRGHLRNVDAYLGGFPEQERSTCFEYLTALAFSQILHLPFYSADNDDKNIEHRVTWQGSDKGGALSKAPGGGPDSVACCYGFHLTIEATRKTGAGQWSGEFAQSVRHCQDFVHTSAVNPAHVYIVLVTPKLHEDTYRSLHHHPPQRGHFIPLETSCLARILDTSVLAFTMKHLELRGLFNKVPEYLSGSASLEDFRRTSEDEVRNWQKEVLRLEKSAFIGVKSYEAMRKIPRAAVAESEILQSLLRHPFVGQYLNILGEKLRVGEIEKVLVGQNLGYRAGRTIQTDEPILECVPCVDFKGRALRLVKAVESIAR